MLTICFVHSSIRESLLGFQLKKRKFSYNEIFCSQPATENKDIDTEKCRRAFFLHVLSFCTFSPCFVLFIFAFFLFLTKVMR